MRRARDDYGSVVGAFLLVALLMSIIVNVYLPSDSRGGEGTIVIVGASTLAGLTVWTFYRSKCGRKVRYARHICPKCRYDMRATPGKCSECGYAKNSGKE